MRLAADECNRQLGESRGGGVVSWHLLKDLHDWYAEAAARVIDSGHQVEPAVLVLGKGREPGSVQCIPLTSAVSTAYFAARDVGPLLSLAASMVSGKGPDAEAFKALAGADPWGLLVLSQGWMVSRLDGLTPAEAAPIEPHFAQEALIMTFHVPFGSRSVIHPIVAAPRRCQLVPFPTSDGPAVLVRHINASVGTGGTVYH